ncbi:hypothetical protein CWO91_36090 [Bradyrhizobium genosp. SA-3]|nr:hypothetical protein CWO91_36090 [Bradyrhizobium genosp. SA-3]
MKMGTIPSPWRYDATAAHAIQPDNQRRTAILHYASWAAVFRISGLVRLPSIAAISINPRNGAMGQERPSDGDRSLWASCGLPQRVI